MFATRRLLLPLLAASLLTVAGTRTASACHDGECPNQISELTVGFLAADAVILSFDAIQASSERRPGRLYGAAELAFGLIQYPITLGLMFDEGHNYHLSASIHALAATAVAAHGAYVLVRGPKLPSDVRVAPTAASNGAGVSVFGRF